MHPTARILLYLISALALPGLNHFGLVLSAGLVIVGQGVHSWHGLRSGVRLLWRTKWLFVVMFAAYAYMLPGAMAIEALGDYSPSREGLAAAGEQIARLILLLLLLEWMVLRMSTTEIISGLYPILARFERLGVEAERVTVRLALTLQAIDANRGQGLRRLWRWPPDPDALPSGVPLRVAQEPWRWTDRWGVILAAACTVGLWLSASH